MNDKKNRDKKSDKVQGEGDYESARRYRESAEDFAENEDTDQKAEKAKKSLEGDEREKLKQAEKAGKEKAKEFDPQVKRD